jgi:hypothetical protein
MVIDGMLARHVQARTLKRRSFSVSTKKITGMISRQQN